MSFLQQEFRLVVPALKSPATYALTAIGLALAWQVFHGYMPITVAATLMAFLLALQSVIDLRTRQLPHTVNALLAAVGLISSHLFNPGLVSALAAAGLAIMLFMGMAALTTRLTRKPALGGGDLYLVGALGTCFGLSGIPPFLLAVSIIGVAVVACRTIWLPKAQQFAFGPILAMAGFLTILYQEYYWKCITSLMV